MADYEEWAANSPGLVTFVAKKDGQINYPDLSLEALQYRFLEICKYLSLTGEFENVGEAELAIASWVQPQVRQFTYEIGGHGTIAPNVAALNVCGLLNIGHEPFSRLHEGEKAHLEQIVLTTNAVLEERKANPPSFANRIYPRTPDLNLYCPATYDLRSAVSLRSDLDRDLKRQMETVLRLIERQSSYSFEKLSSAQSRALMGVSADDLRLGKEPKGNFLMGIRQHETWLGTEAVACLAASEISAVVRLPNRLNLTRGLVRQFAQHYRSDRPQALKRAELFRGVQAAIADGVPCELQSLIDCSQDGVRIIADAHLEWLDIRGIPLGIRYNVSRIPVTPGNAFIETLSSLPTIYLTPENFQKILVVSGLPEDDEIARQFTEAFSVFGKHWRDKLSVNFVRATSRRELVDAINNFDGELMFFDGHGSHKQNEPGVLWLGDEAVDVWTLRGEVVRPPSIVILSACDTHAADRNHATVANGFLALGCRSVLGSVFPLPAGQAALFAARLLYRISSYVPAAIDHFERSLTWLEVVSGMLRRQLATDILFHLENRGLIQGGNSEKIHYKIHEIMELNDRDSFSEMKNFLLDIGINEIELDREIHIAVATSSMISYLNMGRPETILINTVENLKKWAGMRLSDVV
nr:CHAT domain-containing protein [Methylobacterium sp. ZNC0032]